MATGLAVIGAGTAGCALAAGLRLRGWSGSITLLEIGRGPGGRTATRRSRSDPSFVLNHGAPLFNISASPEPRLLEPLRKGGWKVTVALHKGNNDTRHRLLDIWPGFHEGGIYGLAIDLGFRLLMRRACSWAN